MTMKTMTANTKNDRSTKTRFWKN